MAASQISFELFTDANFRLTVPWLYPAEIFPLEVRAKGNAFGVVGWSKSDCFCLKSASLTSERYR